MQQKRKHLLIMAGGTGGHIMPALAVAKEWQQRGFEVSWLGNESGLEGRLVKENAISFHHVNVTGIRRNGVKKWLSAPFIVFSGLVESYQIMRKIRPKVVLGFGGSVGGPGGLAAVLRRVPLIIHEQNTVPGVTNRILSKFATKVLETFPGTFQVNKKVLQTGNPVRQEICDLASPDRRFCARANEAIHLVVLGGSLGASIFNKMLPQVLGQLKENQPFRVTHQAGNHDVELIKQAYAAMGINADVVSFIHDMPALYASADLVISRSGASTVCELASAGVGSILIPFPFAVDDHQTSNARYLEKAGAALLIPQSSLTEQGLAAELARLFNDRTLLLAMAMSARKMAFSRATQEIVDICLKEIA